MGAKLIAFECTAPAHRPDAERPDKLTIHEGHWAFCPLSATANGHVWSETGGADMNDLMQKAGLLVGIAGSEVAAARKRVAVS